MQQLTCKMVFGLFLFLLFLVLKGKGLDFKKSNGGKILKKCDISCGKVRLFCVKNDETILPVVVALRNLL